MAANAGLSVPDVFLLSENSKSISYFASKRFDFDSNGNRFHLHTLAGLLNIDFRETVIDYTSLLRITDELTRDHRQVVEAFRRMVFNYLGANLDDHSKNISFLMDKTGKWTLSPAYDIGFSSASNNLHAMGINGKRQNATIDDFEKIASDFDISEWRKIVSTISDSLLEWPIYAEKHLIPQKLSKAIFERIREACNRVNK